MHSLLYGSVCSEVAVWESGSVSPNELPPSLRVGLAQLWAYSQLHIRAVLLSVFNCNIKFLCQVDRWQPAWLGGQTCLWVVSRKEFPFILCPWFLPQDWPSIEAPQWLGGSMHETGSSCPSAQVKGDKIHSPSCSSASSGSSAPLLAKFSMAPLLQKRSINKYHHTLTG